MKNLIKNKSGYLFPLKFDLKMKLTTLLLFISLFTIQANNYAQNTKITLDLEGVSVETVLNKIESVTEFKFLFNRNDIDINRIVSVHSKEKKIDNVLNQIFQKRFISYEYFDEQIILVKNSKKDLIDNNSNLKPTVTIIVGEGIIHGNVIDQQTKEGLPFASVVVKGTTRGVTTDPMGYFRIPKLDAGTITLVVSFIGYVEQEKEVTLENDAELKVNFEMIAATNMLEGVSISGMRKGEVKALSQMKASSNIKYVLSTEQIERFPDKTVSESLQRVPGVAVGYSYGVPRDIIIRGLGQSLSSITVNGNRLPSTSPGRRTTDLNGVLSTNVESIEVIKTLRPDLDADGTGGTVNIVSKKPKAHSKIIEANVSGGYNSIESKMDYGAGFTYGKRKEKTGFIVGANYLKSNIGEDRVEKFYDDFDVNGTEVNLLEEYELSYTNLERDNFNLSGEFDFYPNDHTDFYIRSSYNKYYEFQNRYSRNYELDDYSSANHADDIEAQSFGNWRDYNRDLFILSIGGKTSLSSIDLDYDVTYSNGSYHQPIYYRASFERGGLSGNLNLSDPLAPFVEFDQSNPTDPSEYTTSRYINRNDKSKDNDIQTSINASMPFNLGSSEGILNLEVDINIKILIG